MKTKTCHLCGEDKPASEYQKQSRSKDGLCPVCKPCYAERRKGYYAKNKDKILARCRKYVQENSELVAERQRKYHKKNRAKILQQHRERYAVEREQRRAKRIDSLYGISVEEYDAAMRRGCAICRSYENMAMDHCHSTGRVRDALCGRCNQALGLFADDAERVQAAASYLIQHDFSDELAALPTAEPEPIEAEVVEQES